MLIPLSGDDCGLGYVPYTNELRLRTDITGWEMEMAQLKAWYDQSNKDFLRLAASSSRSSQEAAKKYAANAQHWYTLMQNLTNAVQGGWLEQYQTTAVKQVTENQPLKITQALETARSTYRAGSLPGDTTPAPAKSNTAAFLVPAIGISALSFLSR